LSVARDCPHPVRRFANADLHVRRCSDRSPCTPEVRCGARSSNRTAISGCLYTESTRLPLLLFLLKSTISKSDTKEHYTAYDNCCASNMGSRTPEDHHRGPNGMHKGELTPGQFLTPDQNRRGAPPSLLQILPSKLRPVGFSMDYSRGKTRTKTRTKMTGTELT
jgi:hypothetical protein